MSQRFLVVDDSRTVRIQIRRTLQMAGYDTDGVVEAANGIEALAALGVGRFDALLTDIHMPAMDGVELVRRVRAHPPLAGLPILVISSESTEERRSQLRSLGADSVLAKPFTPESIKAVLADLLAPRTP